MTLGIVVYWATERDYMRLLRQAVLAGLSAVLLFGSGVTAYAATDLLASTDKLVLATEELNALSADVSSMSKDDVDKAFESVVKDASSGIENLKKDVSSVSDSVGSLSSACTSLSSDVGVLNAKLNALDDLDRRGWSYTPPPAGQAHGIDIARAAVDVATSAQPDPEYTDPSDVHAAYYVEIHDRFLAGEDYRACSVVTSTAIHWSGADSDFPRNTSSIVHKYCADSPKWQLVGHGPDKSQMQPGDIFTSDYHTYMYIGNEVVRERFPFSDADVYTGGNQLPFLYWDSYDNRNYDVYRFVGNG